MDQQADVLGRVARSVQHLDADLELELLAVVEGPAGIAELSLRRAQQLHVASRRHLGQAREVVIVAVGVGGEAHPQALHASGLEVAIDVSTGIEQQGFARLLRADQVRGVAEAL